MPDSKTTQSSSNSEDELVASVNAAAAVDRTHRDFRFHSRKPAIRAAEKFVAKKAFSPRLRAALQKLLNVLMPRRLTPQESREYAAAQGVFWTDQGATAAFWGASAKMELFERITRSLVDENRQIDRLRQLLSACPQSPMTLAFETAEPWAHAAKSDIDALPKALLAKWPALLAHIQSAKGSKPSAKWLKNAQILVDAFDRKRFHELLTRWLPLTAQNRTDSPPANAHGPDQKLLLSRHSEVTLKGLAWTATLFDDPDVIASLGDLGEACWRKILLVWPALHTCRQRRALGPLRNCCTRSNPRRRSTHTHQLQAQARLRPRLLRSGHIPRRRRHRPIPRRPRRNRPSNFRPRRQRDPHPTNRRFHLHHRHHPRF